MPLNRFYNNQPMSKQQAMAEEQISFESKLANIHNTNCILDQLQRKMNSYFIAQTKAPGEGSLNPGGSQIIDTKNPHTYTDYQQQQPAQQQQMHFQIYSKGNQGVVTETGAAYRRNAAQQNREKVQRLSQTTLTYHQNKRTSQSQPQRKFTNQFRLIGKSASREQQGRPTNKDSQVQQPVKPTIPIQNRHANQTQAKKYHKAKQEPYLLEQYHQQRNHNKNQQNTSNIGNREEQVLPKPTNNLVNQIQTMQAIMRQKLQAKERRLKQIQHQIMTQNQQRVYLYKVNVRLNEEIKYLKQQRNLQGIEKQQNEQTRIKTLQAEVARLRSELAKRKGQRKQLRREEQTLREGYQTVLNNKKTVLKKNIQNYSNQQNKVKQNTQMLRSLMKQLDKLKQVVESKIKNSGTSNSNTRKVVKSFKN